MQKTIPFDVYRARVLGCWLGKANGGTLGGPFEGHYCPNNSISASVKSRCPRSSGWFKQLHKSVS